MQPLINLLAWRKLRRRRRLRWWGALAGASMGGSAVLALCLHNIALQEETQQRLRLAEAETLGSGLLKRIEQRTERIQKQAVLQEALAQQAARQQEVARWQTRLVMLGEIIPGDVWLTTLELTPAGLRMQGHTRRLAALTLFQQALGQLAGFSVVRPGEVVQDGSERWRFSLSLYKEVKHVSPS